MAEFELTNQITRILSRERRHSHVAASDWLNRIRGPKSLTNLTLHQLSGLPHTERLVPDSGTFKNFYLYIF